MKEWMVMINKAVITDSEKEWYLKINSTYSQYPKDKTVHELFEEQVEKTPNNIAVNYEEKVLTYAQLNIMSNQVARVLLEKGVKPNNVVGIMLGQSLEMIVGILGILKSGAAYLPIDPRYPEDRIKYMLKDSKVSILLVNKEVKFNEKIDCNLINLKDEMLYSHSGEKIENVSLSNNLMYVIYTSGSTGRPKGVMVLHNSFVNLINWFVNEFEINSRDKNLLIASISFDLAQKNLFATLLKGGQLLLSDSSPYNYNNMSDIIYKHEITIINCTPSAFYPFIDCNIYNEYYRLAQLRYIFLGGEFINTKKIGDLTKYIKCEFVNTYGPTECTDIVSYYRIKKEDFDRNNPIPVGKPINNTRLYILDEEDNILLPNLIGDLYVGGDGLSPGYYNNDILTNEKFKTIEQFPEIRLYKTGDRAKWISNGNIELIGRDDYQIKIRGYRIELGEIETVLLNCNGVKGAIVDKRKRVDGSNYLCTYLVLESEISITDIKKFLFDKLPEYMIPTAYIKIDDFPLSPNGKIDRNALNEMNIEFQELDNNTNVFDDRDLNENSIENRIRRIFKNCSNNIIIDRLKVHDDLSILNIDSLIFIKIVVSIEDEFNFDFDDECLVKNNFLTLQSMITYVNSKIR